MTATAEFLASMTAAGLAPMKGLPEADGRLHRYRVEGDKAGSCNGWYVLHQDPIPAGAFGSWKTGETYTWRDTSRPINSSGQAAHRRQLAALRQVRQEEEVSVRAAAALKATRLWRLARPARPDHPYLTKKGVRAWGLRQLRDMLLIPARDAAGYLRSLQFIGPDGGKRFLTGGGVYGCYYAIGALGGAVLIAEGYATAASLHEATGYAVAVAFNAGNMEPVARALRAKLPTVRIIICADDDRDTPGNPGVTAALKAARAVCGCVARPEFNSAQP